MYPPQDPYSSSSSSSGAGSSSPQNPYPQGSYPNSGAYPPQPGPYAPQGSYAPPQGPYSSAPQGSYASARNGRAQRAIIYGFISLALSLITLFTLAGYAGIITGVFSIIYGIQGLGVAKSLPNGKGRGQSITAIVLGSVAVFLVILAIGVRALIGSAN